MKKKTLFLTLVFCAVAMFTTNNAEAAPTQKMHRGEKQRIEHVKRINNHKHFQKHTPRHQKHHLTMKPRGYHGYHRPIVSRRDHIICHNYDYDRVYIDLPGFHISF